MMQVVQDHLWSRHPPEPAGDDDLRFEQLQQEEALQEKARAKVHALSCIRHISTCMPPRLGFIVKHSCDVSYDLALTI